MEKKQIILKVDKRLCRLRKGRLCEETSRRIPVRGQGDEPLTKQDLVPLVLTPLMSGKDSMEDRIRTILAMLRECEKKVNEELSKEDIKKLESIVYAFANKFLNPAELEKVEEVLKLSLLGQMIFEDGMETGMKRGMEKSVVKIVTTMLRKNKTAEEIHEDTDIPMKQILKIKESLDSHSSKR